jgi:hypothetical protein
MTNALMSICLRSGISFQYSGIDAFPFFPKLLTGKKQGVSSVPWVVSMNFTA